MDFIHPPYQEAYSHGAVIAIDYERYVTPGQPSYLIQYTQYGVPTRHQQWFLRAGLIRLKTAVEVLGEEYFG